MPKRFFYVGKTAKYRVQRRRLWQSLGEGNVIALSADSNFGVGSDFMYLRKKICCSSLYVKKHPDNAHCYTNKLFYHFGRYVG